MREGGTVIIPTETVYGLAADATNPTAVAQIFAAKGRPQDNPLIVHIDSLAMLPPLVREIPEAAFRLAGQFWPGPLTIIMEKSETIPLVTSGGLSTVAIRMPAHPVARAIILAAGVPLAAPSANRSGSPSPTTYAHCVADMLGRVDAIVDSGPCQVGVESTVVTLCTNPPRLLRPGAVTLEELRRVLPKLVMDKGVLEQLDSSVRVSSPGMKYKHYSPQTEVVLLKGSGEGYAHYLGKHGQAGDWAICFTEDAPAVTLPTLCYGNRDDHTAQASSIFRLLRQLDDNGAQRAFVHAPATDGVGLAVYNRLIRAAAFHIIELD